MFIRKISRLLTAAVAAVLLAGCATAPPVQEMSDARQVIAAAREAGAAERVPAMLQEAEDRLANAQAYLNRGDSSPNWSFARRDARAAKEIALEALLRSREERDLEAGSAE